MYLTAILRQCHATAANLHTHRDEIGYLDILLYTICLHIHMCNMYGEMYKIQHLISMCRRRGIIVIVFMRAIQLQQQQQQKTGHSSHMYEYCVSCEYVSERGKWKRSIFRAIRQSLWCDDNGNVNWKLVTTMRVCNFEHYIISQSRNCSFFRWCRSRYT